MFLLRNTHYNVFGEGANLASLLRSPSIGYVLFKHDTIDGTVFFRVTDENEAKKRVTENLESRCRLDRGGRAPLVYTIELTVKSFDLLNENKRIGCARPHMIRWGEHANSFGGFNVIDTPKNYEQFCLLKGITPFVNFRKIDEKILRELNIHFYFISPQKEIISFLGTDLLNREMDPIKEVMEDWRWPIQGGVMGNKEGGF